MVKTRSQQKITFSLRKLKSRSKSVRKSLDADSKEEKSCCIATLARVCRDIEIFEKSPSPAKKSRRDSEALPPDNIQGDSVTGSSRRSRRILSHEEDQENNIVQVAGTRNTKTGKHTATNIDEIRSSIMLTKNLPDTIHSPKKSHDDVITTKVSQCGTPLKANLRLERSGRRLASCKSAGNLLPRPGVTPHGRRRHSVQITSIQNIENNLVQTAPTRNTKPGKPITTNVDEVKSSIELTKKLPDDIVHSPIKSHDDIIATELTQCGSPLKANLGLECSGRRLTSCRSASNLLPRPGMLSGTPHGKRRHSIQITSIQNNEARASSSLTAMPGYRKGLSFSCLENATPNQQMLCLSRQEGKVYKEAKHALHSSIPSNLLCRETETKQIETFLKVRLVHRKSGSLYISGAPGTGKTACLTRILEHLQKDDVECQVQFINCMNLSRSHRIFSKIAEELTGWDKLTNKEAGKFLEKKFSTKGLPLVLVLDEIDQLESKNQDVLYTMFEWPALPCSRLILIGIANALDLTDRVLPRLQLRPECKPKLLHFSPYSKDQIVKILTARLSEVEGSSIVDVSAVQFCARKIAAVSGDMRKALDICRRAVELVETDVKRQQVLKPIETTASPKKCAVKKVTIAHISKVISEVYGSRIVNSCGGEQPTIPLQQKLLICTILLMQKESKLREIPVGQLHDTYCSICKKRQVSQISQEDCLSLCNLLETRGIISMKRAKETRMTKVSLKIDESEVDHALQDKILMTSILQGGLSPS